MQINVIENAKRNLVFGMLNKIVLLVCPFIEKYVVQIILGPEYLGLGSLFSSIISVLSLSELGFGTAMIYNMYKPVADGDVNKVNAILQYYKKVYRIIGSVILGLGVAIIPMLPHLIKGDCPAGINLGFLYVIYLGNTVLSYYLFAYLTSLIVVYQREDIRSNITAMIRLSLTASQIVILITTGNYYLFAILMPVFTILNNLLIAWRVKTVFPQYKAKGSLMPNDISGIKKLVFGTFIQQACAICISAFLGLTFTGIYNNYFLVITGVTSFVSLITNSFMGGVGNHVATKSRNDNYIEMKKLDFVYLWIAGWCMICLLCLFQPFMRLWMGGEMMLPMSAVFLLCGYFYLLKLGDIRSIYSSANGLWWEHRYRAVGETVLNVVLNIVLGKTFGIVGIILATMISLFFCNYLWAVGITFRLYFSIGQRKDYYLYQVKQTLCTIIVCGITYAMCITVPNYGLVSQLLLRGVLCLVVPNLMFYLIYRNNEVFSYVKRLLTKM